ncbi:MAG TPA: undecaprenyl-diphosphate phosphatase [bacterium]|nr:undecaprenyl-diphosphate phosphatase [bacterium]
MNIFQAIILGLTQGITEWFPVSSSGHLALVQYFFNIKVSTAFDVFLHFASLFVIVLIFWKDIEKLIVGIIHKDKQSINLFLYLIIASIPAGIIGFLLKDKIDSIFSNILYIGISLTITSLILFFTKFAKNKNRNLNFKNSLLIGIFQAIAILPGISRSGSTISAGLFSGLDPKVATKFSFLLSIPVILGSTILEAKNIGEINNILDLLISCIITVVIGFLSLRYILKVVDKNKFKYFSLYCFILGSLVIIYSLSI